VFPVKNNQQKKMISITTTTKTGLYKTVLLQLCYIIKIIKLSIKLLIQTYSIHSKKILLFTACAITQQNQLLELLRTLAFLILEGIHNIVPYWRVCLQLRLTVEWFVILNPYEYPWLIITIPTEPLFDFARFITPGVDGLILGIDFSILIVFRLLYYIDKFALYGMYKLTTNFA